VCYSNLIIIVIRLVLFVLLYKQAYLHGKPETPLIVDIDVTV